MAKKKSVFDEEINLEEAGMQPVVSSGKQSNTWKIIGIIFIVLFIVGVGALGALLMSAKSDAAMLAQQKDSLELDVASAQSQVLLLQTELDDAKTNLNSTTDAQTKLLAGLNNRTAMADWPIVAELPKDSVLLTALLQSICLPESDGPCGLPFNIYTLDNKMYIVAQGAVDSLTYGPFDYTDEEGLWLKSVAVYVSTLEL